MNLKDYRAGKRSEKAANAAHVRNQMMVITNENFFTEDNANGFISKQEFLDHIDEIIESASATNSLKMFFNQISEKSLRLRISPFVWTSPTTNKSMFFIDSDSNVSRRYAVLNFKGLGKLLDGLTHGKFVCQLDADELFKRANQAQ